VETTGTIGTAAISKTPMLMTMLMTVTGETSNAQTSETEETTQKVMTGHILSESKIASSLEGIVASAFAPLGNATTSNYSEEVTFNETAAESLETQTTEIYSTTSKTSEATTFMESSGESSETETIETEPTHSIASTIAAVETTGTTGTAATSETPMYTTVTGEIYETQNTETDIDKLADQLEQVLKETEQKLANITMAQGNVQQQMAPPQQPAAQQQQPPPQQQQQAAFADLLTVLQDWQTNDQCDKNIRYQEIELDKVALQVGTCDGTSPT
jgi:hypothetical protein